MERAGLSLLRGYDELFDCRACSFWIGLFTVLGLTQTDESEQCFGLASSRQGPDRFEALANNRRTGGGMSAMSENLAEMSPCQIRLVNLTGK